MLVVASFALTVCVTLAVVVQVVVLGTRPWLYPLLGVAFPVMLLLNNADFLRLLLDMFLPDAVDKAAYFTVLAAQLLVFVLLTFVGIGGGWWGVAVRILLGALLAVQLALMVVLFVRRRTYDTSATSASCAIGGRVRAIMSHGIDQEPVLQALVRELCRPSDPPAARPGGARN